MADHADLSIGYIHIPYNWEYADSATRLAATGFSVNDVGKLSRQIDDNTLWMLIDDDPATWLGMHAAELELLYIWSLDRPKDTPDDPPDDEFGEATLDGKWTVVDGASGTITLFETGGNKYDLASRAGWLLMLSDNGNHIKLRQDYSLPDSYCIILAISVPTTADGQSGIANNQTRAGLALNDDNDDYLEGNYVYILWDSNTNGWRIMASDDSTVYSTPSGDNLTGAPIAQKVYFRICRVGLKYYPFWSADGTSWMPLGPGYTMAGALSNVWIINQSDANPNDPTPVVAVDWIRLGGNGVDPW